jgi:hypothetical protein
MSETPSNEPSHAAEDVNAPVAEPEATSAVKPTTSHAARTPTFAKWGTVAALVLAILAVAGAAYGYFFPNESAAAAGKYTDQQRDEAKKKICETFKIVERAVVKSSHLKNPDNGGPIGGLSVATARNFAFYSGGALLRDQVLQNPATPADLTKSANELATSLEELTIGSLGGAAQFTQDELGHSADEKLKAIVDICK